VVSLAIGTCLGVSGLAFAFHVRPDATDSLHAGVPTPASSPRARRAWQIPTTVRARSLIVPAVVGIVVAVVTRWPVAGVLGALAAVVVPGQFLQASPRIQARKVEAIAVWTELLRDTLAASAGLGQAIVATAPSAPDAIHDQVAMLAGRVVSGVPVEVALRSFADDVDDPSVDLVVCALVMAATSRAQRLVELLSALAGAIREDVAMRLRVDSSRASARSSVRTVIVFSLLFAALLIVVAHSYLAPFGSAEGQIVLIAVGLLYSGGIGLMVRMVRPQVGPRLLGRKATR
jgi:Flp pilus assembly protein TadB